MHWAPRRQGLGRRYWLGGLLVGLTLVVAACGRPEPPVHGTPGQGTPVPGSLSVFMAGGALRASDGTVRWTRDLGARPPVIADGVLYATVNAGSSPSVVAVRAGDGVALWSATQSGEVGPFAVAGDRVIVPVLAASMGRSGLLTLVALSVSDGHVIWRSAPLAAVRPPTVDTPVPFVSALAISQGRIVATASSARDASYIAAWSLQDGSLAWQQPLADAAYFGGAYASVVATDTTVTLSYRVAGEERITAIDPLSGRGVWPVAPNASSLDLATASLVVVSDPDTGVVTGLHPGDGSTLWTRNLGTGGDATSGGLEEVAASDSALFYERFESCTAQGSNDLSLICRPNLYVVSLADGALLWHRALDAAQRYLATTIFAGESALYYQYFYNQGNTEHFRLMALGASDGATRWTEATSGLFFEPLVEDGTIFAQGVGAGPPSSTTIGALSAVNGSLIWVAAATPCGAFLTGCWIEVG
jgi:outer membrane protein assembly factor BamB